MIESEENNLLGMNDVQHERQEENNERAVETRIQDIIEFEFK